MPRYLRDSPARTGDLTLFKIEPYVEGYDAFVADWQGGDVSFLVIGFY